MITANDVCITRVLGNYNPPRIYAKDRIAELKFILDKESGLGVKNLWLLNRIFDKDYLNKIKKILKSNNQNYHEVNFKFSDFKNKKSKEDKIFYYTNINPARNVAVKLALLKSRYVACLDGDCFFTKDLFEPALDKINKNPNYPYYGLMTKRVTDPKNLKVDLVDTEPFIIFTRSSSKYFNKDIIFGQNDKNILLWELGFDEKQMKKMNYKVKPSGGHCLVVGDILHVSFADSKLEKEHGERKEKRNESLMETIKLINTQYSWENKKGLELIKSLENAEEITPEQAVSLREVAS